MTNQSPKIGLQLPEIEYVSTWQQNLAMAKLAEEVGFDSIWVGDHLQYSLPDQPPRGPWECLTQLSALAAATTRIELGPLVLSTSFRNPALTAKIAENIDEISGGRFILGLGAGWNQTEYEAFGFPFDRRVARFSEAFHIIHTLVRTGNIDFEGEFYSARNCELLPRGPRPGTMPIMIGSTGEKMLRITLPHVDLWNIWYADFGNSVDGLRPHLDKLDRICREVGRDPQEIGRTAAVLVTAPGGSTRTVGAPQERRVPGLTGTPDEIADKLRAFFNAGIGHIQIVLDPITPEAITWLAPAIDLLKRDQLA